MELIDHLEHALVPTIRDVVSALLCTVGEPVALRVRGHGVVEKGSRVKSSRYSWRVLTGFVALSVVSVGAAGLALALPADERSARLAADLRRAIVDQEFSEVLDTRSGGETGRPARIHQTPNVDVAVIELDKAGNVLAAANVLQTPQYPNGKIVSLDANLSTTDVRWRRWDDTVWDTNRGKGTTDAVPGRENAPIDYMSPYPASVLKLLVGFGVLGLVDDGVVALDDNFAYQRPAEPTGGLCGPSVTKPIRQFFDQMMTVSSNEATCALINLLHTHKAMDPLNQQFKDLGLPMLQLVNTRADGGGWINTQMSALDTAKLLMIINGGPGTLWTAPNGTVVTKTVLSDSSRAFFLQILGDQGLNQVLSTTNWCGRAYPARGIPQRTPDRWINPADGTMTVGGRVYGRDVRPCQQQAEVTFAHKTGLADTSGSDAGIVHSLPGKPDRDYIVVIHSNLGDRYVDPNRLADPPGLLPVKYTQKFGRLGRAIDTILTQNAAR